MLAKHVPITRNLVAAAEQWQSNRNKMLQGSSVGSLTKNFLSNKSQQKVNESIATQVDIQRGLKDSLQDSK